MINQIREALDRSGYLMEQRLCPIVEQHGFHATPNHEYEDPDTGKSREIDIHALSVISLYRETFIDMFTPTILVSCRNNRLPVVAFSHNNVLRGVDVAVSIPKAGYPLAVIGTRGTEDIEPFLRMGQFHHYYCARWIATQYCRIAEKDKAKKGQSGEYVADHGDLYNDLDSLVKAVNAEMSEYQDVAIEEKNKLSPTDNEADINLVFIYSAIVFSGELYDCRQSRRGVTLRPANHIVLTRGVKSRAVKGQFFVDLVREPYFRRYLQLIGRECQTLKDRLRRYRRVLRRSVVRQLSELEDRQPRGGLVF